MRTFKEYMEQEKSDEHYDDILKGTQGDINLIKGIIDSLISDANKLKKSVNILYGNINVVNIDDVDELVGSALSQLEKIKNPIDEAIDDIEAALIKAEDDEPSN